MLNAHLRALGTHKRPGEARSEGTVLSIRMHTHFDAYAYTHVLHVRIVYARRVRILFKLLSSLAVQRERERVNQYGRG